MNDVPQSSPQLAPHILQAYRAPQNWQGRNDALEGPLALRWHQRVQSFDLNQTPVPHRPNGAERGIALLGFCCDAGVQRNQGRIGAHSGPAALRSALANLAWHQDSLEIIDVGDIHCAGDALEAAQTAYAQLAAALLDAGWLPIGLGGGHEIAFASWQALQRSATGAQRLSIINFDAHLDLRTLDSGRGSSGTPFRQIALESDRHGVAFQYRCIGVSEAANTAALFEYAQHRQVKIVLDSALNDTPVHALPELLCDAQGSGGAARLSNCEQVYLTLCMDVFPAASAPGVSAPAALGVDPPKIEALVREIAASGKLRLFDVAELNPNFDQDSRTAKLAARMIWQVCKVLATLRPSTRT